MASVQYAQQQLNATTAASSSLAAGTLSSWDVRTTAGSALALVVTLLVLEQWRYRSKKQHLPGPEWTIPVIGKFLDSMKPSIENYKAGWDLGELSVASVFHIFIVMASSNKYARKVFNSPTYAEPCLVASAKQVLLAENWVFLHGKEHADYRRGLNGLFTRRALSIYLPIMETVYKSYFTEWMADPGPPKEYMMPMRDLNMEVSLRVFCGQHISPEDERAIGEKYWLITRALELVNFPLALPGTNVHAAIGARKIAMAILMDVAAKSKLSMAAGDEPTCLVDAWIKSMIDARTDAGDDDEETRKVLVREFSDHEIAMVVLSFLFASQDAMSSSICHAFELLADHPEILARVREEQLRVRGGDVDKPMSFEMLDQMTYTRATIKESLRVLPPVIMVPYMTLKDFPINPEYTVPKGTMLIPSIWPSLHDAEVYPEPDSFIPERWLGPDGKAIEDPNPKNYMVFGAGAHKCIGFEYVYSFMIAAVGHAAIAMNFEHERTAETGKLQVIATIFPKDGLRMKFTPRSATATA